MLDTQGQVTAFQILNSSGLVKPATIGICNAISDAATRQAEAVTALLLVDATYPTTVSDYTDQIPGFAESLNAASGAASALAGAISPYCTPSQLLQMKLGWECHVKGNEISPAPDFWLVTGMGDANTPQLLLDAVTVLALDSLADAMNAVNAKVSAASSGTGDGEGGTAAEPVITEGEIEALKGAVEEFSLALAGVTPLYGDVNTLAGNINTSTKQAAQALDSAVSITLTSSMKNDAVMLPAITLIMPDGVMEALNAEGED